METRREQSVVTGLGDELRDGLHIVQFRLQLREIALLVVH